MVAIREVTILSERSVTMKIYLFNPETGIYQGEDFADDLSMCEERKALPLDATTIAPPPYGRGEAPFFTVAENKWEIRPVSAAVAGGDDAPCEQAGRQSKRQPFKKAPRQEEE